MNTATYHDEEVEAIIAKVLAQQKAEIIRKAEELKKNCGRDWGLDTPEQLSIYTQALDDLITAIS